MSPTDTRVTVTLKLRPGKDDDLISWWASLEKGTWAAAGDSRNQTLKDMLRLGVETFLAQQSATAENNGKPVVNQWFTDVNLSDTSRRSVLRTKEKHCHYCGVELIDGSTPKAEPFYEYRSVQNEMGVTTGWYLKASYGIYTIDHIIPRSKGGTNRPANLVACCDRCNHLKRDQDYESFKAWVAGNNHEQDSPQSQTTT